METVWDLLRSACDRDPGATLVAEVGGRAETAEGLLRAAEGRARGRQARGVEPGDSVVVQLPHGLEAVRTLLALARLGARAVPLHPAVPIAERERVARDCAARLVV